MLDAVQHYHIEFTKMPYQTRIPRDLQCEPQEAEMITSEIAKLLEKGAIVKTNHVEGEFISNIFIRPKKDGSSRPIINLKGLNTFVVFSF